jgi:hypothetical protein
VVPSGYGILSEFEAAATLLTVAPKAQLQSIVSERIIPLMMDSFSATSVTGITIDAMNQQALISFSKIAMLAQQFSEDQAKKKIDQGVLGGIMPLSLTLHAFLDALTRVSPMMFTIPVHRMDCGWHFQTSAIWSMPAAPANGIIWASMITASPLASDTHFGALQGLRKMSANNAWRYLRYCVLGINRLQRFLHDPRSFRKSDGTVDLIKKVQAYGAVHLLFADISALNFSTVSHNRISYAMSALDKLANLRAQMTSSPPYSEGTAMAEMASLSQAVELVSMVKKSMKSLGYDEMANSFEAVINHCYEVLHEHLSNQSPTAKRSEKARLSRIRSQRNIRHGTFLQANQFQELFFDSDGTLPETIGSLPYLLTLGFLSDPKAFLDFKPVVPN